MFRFFKYILLFIAGYKIIKLIFAQTNTQQRVPQTPPKSNINSNNHQQNTSPSPHSKFNDAEMIDYEEIK